MVRPLHPALHVAVSRQLHIDSQDQQQEEPLLQQISAPSSPASPRNTDSLGLLNPLHALQPHSQPPPAPQHGQGASQRSLILPVLDAKFPSALSLPPYHSHAAVSASASSASAAPSSSPSPVPRVVWLLAALLHVAVVLLSLLSLHFVSMQFQQTQLRCSVLSAAHLLSLPYPAHASAPSATASSSSLSLHHWWDFGTLLGLVREDDLIFTEVDADLSLTWRARDRLSAGWESDPAMRRRWAELGFVRLQHRDALKLRVFDSWGWFLDADVWEEQSLVNDSSAAAAAGLGSNRSAVPARASASDRSSADDAVRMQMVTGRLSPALYNLPSAVIFPIRQRAFPSHWAHQCRAALAAIAASSPPSSSPSAAPLLSLPAQPSVLLEHWYGAGWVRPRRFDKGLDRSSDAFENLMWTQAETAYELFWALKVAGRIALNAAAYHRLLLLWYAASALVFTLLAVRWTRAMQRGLKAKQPSAAAAATCPSCSDVACALLLRLSSLVLCCGYLLVLAAGLFVLDNSLQLELGTGMHRGLLPGLCLPLALLLVCLRWQQQQQQQRRSISSCCVVE